MILRTMTEKDSVQVAYLEVGGFRVPWSIIIILETIRNPLNHLFVLENEEIIIGYCCLQLIADEGEIQRIVVSARHRGQGLSKQMMECMVSFSKEKGVGALTLEVRFSNIAARNLYRSYGFIEEAVRRGYYTNPIEDAIIMWKRDI